VTVFPEPPNRSNLTLQHGHLPSLWAAAQQGLFLQPFGTGSDINLRKDQPATSFYSNPATPAERQSPASPAVTITANSHSTNFSGASADASHARHQPAHDDEDDPTLSRLTNASANPAQHHSGPEAPCPLQTATLATDPCPEIPPHRSSQQPPAQSSCWSTDPVGPSAASLLEKLRWVALGPQFNWSTRQYENEPGVKPLPSELVTLARQAVQACEELHLVTDNKTEPLSGADVVGLQTKHDCAATASCCSDDRAKLCSVNMASSNNEECGAADEDHVLYEPNTALVNFYREGDTLGGHKDDAELHKTRPIVSISVGCDAVFLMGGQTKDVVPTAVWLHSGDAVILSGPARQCYHGVPRVRPGQLACAAAITTATDGGIIDYMQHE